MHFCTWKRIGSPFLGQLITSRSSATTYETQIEERSSHRFTRGNDTVDLLVADHLPPSVDCHIRVSTGGDVTISVPDVLGALTLKCGAYLVDPRDKNRHLEDAAILFATITNPTDLRISMRGSDGERIRALSDALTAAHHPAWETVRRHFESAPVMP